MRFGAAVTLLLTGLVAPLYAADPAPPVVAYPAPPPVVVVRPVYRVSRYEVWQNYGVNFQGRFVPRVVYTPDGQFYYYYNGAPFPWASVHPQEFTPFATD
jgi:hypothetical protein